MAGHGGATGLVAYPRIGVIVVFVSTLHSRGIGRIAHQEQSLVLPLLRVLSAMCVRSPERGYTQGMNFVAAVLLLHVPEEEAFWCLAGVQDIFIPKLWDEPSRTGRVVELHLLDHALASTVPRVAEHLRCIDTSCFATSWVDTLFAGNWPSDVVARCFDGLLSPQYPAALQRIILAYLESIEDIIVHESAKVSPSVADRAIAIGAATSILFTEKKRKKNSNWKVWIITDILDDYREAARG